MVARLAIVVFIAAVAVSLEAQRPTFTVDSDGAVSIVLSPSVLSDTAVRKQLGSGLTTTFLLTVRRRDAALTGARIEARYDLWDEAWHVRRIDSSGTVDRQRLNSRDALEKWWRAPVRLFATQAARVSLEIELAVLPFSAAEEEDARQWISKSGGVGTATSGSGFIDALIGTTLAARPITSFRWRIELAVKSP